MKIYRFRKPGGTVVLYADVAGDGLLVPTTFDWHRLATTRVGHLIKVIRGSVCGPGLPIDKIEGKLLAPLLGPVWAAGVTYESSKFARLNESGSNDGYARVYGAHRPELFTKGFDEMTVAGHLLPLILPPESESKIVVTESELAVVANCFGETIGFTICNDVSQRDTEGENMLYLPQAKIWGNENGGSCGLGPCILLTDGDELPGNTGIRLDVKRGGESVWTGETTVSTMKRKTPELVKWLFYGNSTKIIRAFPAGVVLSTGTGIVKINVTDFTHQVGDEANIGIDGIGTLTNTFVEA